MRTNIPHQYYNGAPGLWAYARGLLIETCYALPWTPLALFVGFETDTDDNTTAVVLTIIAKDETTDHHNDIVTVVWRQDRNPGGQGHDVWQLTINGAVRRHPGLHTRPSLTTDPRGHHPRRHLQLGPDGTTERPAPSASTPGTSTHGPGTPI